MEFQGAPSFLKTYSGPSTSHKTRSKKNDSRYPNDIARPAERRRAEVRSIDTTFDATTMLQSLSWLRVSDTARSSSSGRSFEDRRNHEYHHFKPQVPIQPSPRSKTTPRPQVSIPIEYQYQNAPPIHSWLQSNVEPEEEAPAYGDVQEHTLSSTNGDSLTAISPISPCSSRQGRSPSIGSTISPISPIEQNPYPPPIKPLPSIPTAPSRSHFTGQLVRSVAESEKSSLCSTNYSSLNEKASTISPRPSDTLSQGAPLKQPRSPTKAPQVDLEVIFWKELSIAGKRKGLSKVKAIDISNSGSVVAIKHANYNLQFWNIATGALQSTIEVPTYIDAGKRARESYEIGHILISDSEKLAAVITNFGRTLEIWNWAKKKKLQSLDDQVDRWAADRFESFSSAWNPLAIYKARPGVIDLYTAAPSKKPYAKVRIIDLCKAELPYVPQQLELAILRGSHMLVAAIGPKSAKAGHPPPDREIMLAAWDITDYREVSHVPRHFVRPLHHTEIDLAVPSIIVGYENIVVSIWLPPSHGVYRQPHPRTGLPEWKLSSITSSVRHVLVWDLSGNITHVYPVPNTVTCISGDCRFGAYTLLSQGQNKIIIFDAKSGKELRSIEDVNSGSAVTELSFSQDAKLLMVGDAEGKTNVFEVGLKTSAWRN